MRFFDRIPACLAALLWVFVPLYASAQVLYTWPDSTYPCNGTLQACVSAAGPDDGIEIATNGPIDESIHTTGTVDLRAAPGFTPVFAANREITANALITGGNQFIHIEGLTLARGFIQVNQSNHPAALTVQILDNTVLAPFSIPPIQLVAFDGGPLAFTISGNRITTDLFVNRVLSVAVNGTLASGDVVDNVIVIPPNNDAVGIDAYAEDGVLDIDVVRNRIDGAYYHDGIAMHRYGTGVLTGRILGNLVRGASAGGAGILVSGAATPDGNLDVQIVNNTLTGNWNGIEAFGFDTVIANNVITHSVESGLYATASSAVSNHHNLFFGNAVDFEGPAAGPGSVFANPLFVAADDFRLRAGSPAIGAGDSSAVAPGLTTDLAGVPRIQGAAVDIGAYEAPEPSPSWSALAVATLWVRRRFRDPVA